MHIYHLCPLLVLLIVFPAQSQFSYPSSASTRLDFAQLADGGKPLQKWTTTLILANPDPSAGATVKLTFYGDDGEVLPLNFGAGAAPTLVVNLPAGGSRTITSTGDSVHPETGDYVTGWARAVSDVPVYGTVIYRAAMNGTPFWDVAAAGSGPTYYFSSAAKYSLGVALANPNSTAAIHLRLTPKDQDGVVGSTHDVSLPPNGHMSFGLGGALGLASTFSGTVAITSMDSPPTSFLAWTLYERDGLLSPLPAGEVRHPGPYGRRPHDALALAKAGATELVKTLGQQLYNASPETVAQYIAQKGIVVEEDAILTATYKEAGDSIHLSNTMVETMGSSDAGLAFLIGHYLARGILARTGIPTAGIGASSSIQTSADALSLAGLLASGHDPGGMADFLGRLANAQAQGLTMDLDLVNEFGPLEEINGRLSKIWAKVIQGCTATPQFSPICKKAHDYWHQGYPAKIP